MKIIFDKVKQGYTYPITKSNLRLLFQIIPDKWKSGINTVHFLGQTPTKSGFDRPVNKIFLTQKLNLSVLGLDEKEIITQILIELVQDSGMYNNLRAVKNNKLSKRQTKAIQEIINPYIDNYFQQKTSANNT